MEDTLSYIKKYHSDAQFVDYQMLANLLKEMPENWITLFKMQDVADRKKYLLDTIWRSTVNEEFRNTISYLEKHLSIIELIQIDNSLSILYGVTNEAGKIVYYRGNSPLNPTMSENLRNDFDKLPQSLQSFYKKLHNGFYYLASESMGLVPLQSVTRLDDEEWGILDELPQPLPLDMKHSYGFFTNGMGGYVVIDTTKSNIDNAVLWWTKKKPKVNLNFWDVVDEWTVIGMQS